MDYFQLKKEIRNKVLKNAYMFTGIEALLKRSAVDEIVNAFVPEEVRQLNVSYVDSDTNTKAIIDMCETLPFLADKRIVIVKDIGNIKDDNDSIESFSEYLGKMSSSCCIIILAEVIPKTYSVLNKNICTVHFKQLDENMLKKWLIESARKEGVILKKESADLLIQYCLNDMTTLKNELDKLMIYSKEKGSVINKEDIEHVVSKSIQYNVFKMLDYFEKADYDKAYEMYEQINQEGGQAFALLGAITSRYRNVYYAKMLINKGYRGDTLNKQLGINRYAAKSAINAAKDYSTDRLSNIFKLLNETDYKIKIGEVKENDAIRNLLLHLFSK